MERILSLTWAGAVGALRAWARSLIAAVLLSVTAIGVAAQPGPSGTDDAASEQAFVDALRREDPAAAERYATLREARTRAIAHLRRIEAQYSAAGPELRSIFVAPLRQAQRQYAATSLAVLDFLDARDRGLITRYRETIARITTLLEERQKVRAELEKFREP